MAEISSGNYTTSNEIECESSPGTSYPLHLLAGSCSMRALDTAKKLLDSGKYNVNEQEPDWKFTPLHIAANWGNLAMVQLLIHYGADQKVKDDEGNTCMDLTEDPLVRKFLKKMDQPKEVNKVLKILKEVFGMKKTEIRRGRSIRINMRNRKRPASCFAAFEPIKKVRKRRSEQLRTGFKPITDEEMRNIFSSLESKPSSTSKPILNSNIKPVSKSNLNSNSNLMKDRNQNSEKFENTNSDFKNPKVELDDYELIRRLADLNLKNGAKEENNENAVVDERKVSKREKRSFVAVTNEGDELEFEVYQSLYFSTVEYLESSKELEVKRKEVGFESLLPPPRTTSLRKSTSTPVSRYHSANLEVSNTKCPTKLETSTSKDLGTNLESSTSKCLGTSFNTPTSTRVYIRTPTAPLESEDEDQWEDAPLPATPECSSPCNWASGTPECGSLDALSPMTPDTPLVSTPEVSNEIRGLTTLQLRKRLEKVGISPGPLLEDKRKYFEKKLALVEQQRTEVYEGRSKFVGMLLSFNNFLL